MQLLLGFFVVQFRGFESLEFFFIFSHSKISQINTKKTVFSPDFFKFSFCLQLVKTRPKEKKTPEFAICIGKLLSDCYFCIGMSRKLVGNNMQGTHTLLISEM